MRIYSKIPFHPLTPPVGTCCAPGSAPCLATLFERRLRRTPLHRFHTRWIFYLQTTFHRRQTSVYTSIGRAVVFALHLHRTPHHEASVGAGELNAFPGRRMAL